MQLMQIDCGALLVTSSVGVMDPDLPLFQPILLSDLIMLENRLPDGSACTMFTEPVPDQGYLVLKEGVFSKALKRQILEFSGDLIFSTNQEVVLPMLSVRESRQLRKTDFGRNWELTWIP